jgi:hypothetical protein
MTNNVPQTINYTNRDFYSLREDLITRVQTRVKTDAAGNDTGRQWNATDPSDFGVALVEAFAFIGDMANYYIDRAANESVLGTAVQRQSLLDFASLFGYKPSGYRQAVVTVSLTNNGSDDVVLPMGTKLSTTVSNGNVLSTLYFTLAQDAVIATSKTVNVLAMHGQDISLNYTAVDSNDIAGELLGQSSGLPNQEFELAQSPVVQETVQVFVFDGTSYIEWTMVDYLQDYASTDTVFTVSSDGDNVVYITFGDGVNGAIPTLNTSIKATYINGGGIVGNISSGNKFTVEKIPGDTTSGISVSGVNAAAAYGGADPETNSSIRQNAPKALQVLQRAVSLLDYQNLALAVSGVGKAYAAATQPGSVLIYAGPTVSDTDSNYYPGYSSYTNSTTNTIDTNWTVLQQNVLSYFQDKTQIGTTITLAPPTYVDVSANIQFRALPGQDYGQIVDTLRYGLVYGFGYNFLDFNKVIFPESVDTALNAAPGVSWVRTDALYRTGASVARTNLVPVAANGEYFVFNDAHVQIYPTASLSGLTISGTDITFNPVFASHLLTYTVKGVSTSSVTVTPTAWDSSWVIKVNGTTVTSGSASGSISTPSGATTTVTVTVATSDGTTLPNTYTLSIVR